uniref:Uncharacterized protein n=1 Tax=Anguilla anguilla TaxID=7936 RepID=A0A0E9RUN0_ANGAN
MYIRSLKTEDSNTLIKDKGGHDIVRTSS